MPVIIHLRAGETRQLRTPPGGVGRWTSSAPAVVTSSDEDLSTGNPGGLLTGIKVGLARITAFGDDKKTTVGEWDVEVESASASQSATVGQEASTIRVGKNETVDLPGNPDVTGWTIANPRVAEMAGAGRVRGLSPGITTARRQEGGAAAECSIEVSGTLDLAVNQTSNLASFFSCPIRSWRTSSPSEVQIDAQGVVTTGGRPRTVEVSAVLASGRVFQFNLRIAGPRPPPAAQTPAIDEVAASRPPVATPASAAAAPQTLSPSSPDQKRMVENHLRAAETYLLADNWEQAGAEITAARLVAVTDPDLARRVDEFNERLRTRAKERVAAMIAEAIRLLLVGEHGKARQHLDSARVSRDSKSVVDGVKRLVLACERADSDGDDSTREDLERQLAAVWGEVAQLKWYPALAPLADLGLQHGERIIALVIDALSNPSLSGMPASIRQALGGLASQAGAIALEAVFSKLADANQPPDEAILLQQLLPDLNVAKHAALIVKRYALSPPAEQSRLIECCAALHQHNTTALFDLLAGVVNRLPPDMRLAQAVQKKIGAAELERLARRWWSGGHRGARTVLERLYGYPPNAF